MNRIRELRLKNGWRQEDLAVRMNTRRQTIARYETEQLGIDADTIRRLCEIFDVSADYLICRTNIPKPQVSEEDAELLRLYHAAPPAIRQSVKTILSESVPQVKSEVS